MESLKDSQIQFGAQFEAASVPMSFGNDAAALQAAHEAVAVCDRTHWGRLELAGRDRQSFVHNQSTNDVKSLQPGQGCDTVFVTSTARTIDLATVFVLDAAVRLLVSPMRREYLLSWLDRYIFFGDQVTLNDITDSTATFSLVGPGSVGVLEALNATTMADQPYGHHQLADIAGHPVHVAVGSGLALPGYTLTLERAAAGLVWETLMQQGVVPLGERVWEHLRIEQGRPVPDFELTEDYNPLEAGLWQAVSFNKGCYIGQETIARLDTYKGVKQQLWGVRLQDAAQPGTVLTVGDEKVGLLTSVSPLEPTVGLAYVRTKAGGPGLTVQVGNTVGEILEVPFLTHGRDAVD